ncbi:MAG: hypothetical protein VKJ46_08655 [Leptolyngbyaceae bacterium]|nr:hypothetical protein [Leptolyngbyaceae bacterium]
MDKNNLVGKVKQQSLEPNFSAISDTILGSAQACQGNPTHLLALLRLLEHLHREVRDGLFQESLPDNRQALYSLLREIEAEGGWPYIQRMKLQVLLSNLLVEMDAEAATETALGSSTLQVSEGNNLEHLPLEE